MSELSKKIGVALEVRDKINEQKSDYDIDNQWQASNTDQYAGETVENKGHTHKFLLDDYGNGKTSIDDGYFHMIECYDIIAEVSDGHSHILEMQERTEGETSVGYTFVYNSKGERITSKPPRAHTHEVEVDEYGNGTCSENAKHTHQVRGFKVFAVEDGHSHYRIEQKRITKGKSPWNLGV